MAINKPFIPAYLQGHKGIAGMTDILRALKHLMPYLAMSSKHNMSITIN